jgi:uncharacterized membrane protein
MRFLGHPVHVMLVHFPVALWPAHWLFHLFARQFPEGLAAHAGQWLLTAGTSMGWIAAFCGLADLADLRSHPDPEVKASAYRHALINGAVLAGFSVLLAVEYTSQPTSHGWIFLSTEGLLLGLMLIGNFWGGRIIWNQISSGSSAH